MVDPNTDPAAFSPRKQTPKQTRAELRARLQAISTKRPALVITTIPAHQQQQPHKSKLPIPGHSLQKPQLAYAARGSLARESETPAWRPWVTPSKASDGASRSTTLPASEASSPVASNVTADFKDQTTADTQSCGVTFTVKAASEHVFARSNTATPIPDWTERPTQVTPPAKLTRSLPWPLPLAKPSQSTTPPPTQTSDTSTEAHYAPPEDAPAQLPPPQDDQSVDDSNSTIQPTKPVQQAKPRGAQGANPLCSHHSSFELRSEGTHKQNRELPDVETVYIDPPTTPRRSHSRSRSSMRTPPQSTASDLPLVSQRKYDSLTPRSKLLVRVPMTPKSNQRVRVPILRRSLLGTPNASFTAQPLSPSDDPLLLKGKEQWDGEFDEMNSSHVEGDLPALSLASEPSLFREETGTNDDLAPMDDYALASVEQQPVATVAGAQDQEIDEADWPETSSQNPSEESGWEDVSDSIRLLGQPVRTLVQAEPEGIRRNVSSEVNGSEVDPPSQANDSVSQTPTEPDSRSYGLSSEVNDSVLSVCEQLGCIQRPEYENVQGDQGSNTFENDSDSDKTAMGIEPVVDAEPAQDWSMTSIGVSFLAGRTNDGSFVSARSPMSRTPRHSLWGTPSSSFDHSLASAQEPPSTRTVRTRPSRSPISTTGVSFFSTRTSDGNGSFTSAASPPTSDLPNRASTPRNDSQSDLVEADDVQSETSTAYDDAASDQTVTARDTTLQIEPHCSNVSMDNYMSTLDHQTFESMLYESSRTPYLKRSTKDSAVPASGLRHYAFIPPTGTFVTDASTMQDATDLSMTKGATGASSTQDATGASTAKKNSSFASAADTKDASTAKEDSSFASAADTTDASTAKEDSSFVSAADTTAASFASASAPPAHVPHPERRKADFALWTRSNWCNLEYSLIRTIEEDPDWRLTASTQELGEVINFKSSQSAIVMFLARYDLTVDDLPFERPKEELWSHKALRSRTRVLRSNLAQAVRDGHVRPGSVRDDLAQYRRTRDSQQHREHQPKAIPRSTTEPPSQRKDKDEQKLEARREAQRLADQQWIEQFPGTRDKKHTTRAPRPPAVSATQTMPRPLSAIQARVSSSRPEAQAFDQARERNTSGSIAKPMKGELHPRTRVSSGASRVARVAHNKENVSLGLGPVPTRWRH